MSALPSNATPLIFLGAANFVAVAALPIKLGAVMSLLNVFAPAIVCDPLVSIPPFVASAGVKINSVVPLIVAPLAFDVTAMFPIELNPAFAAIIEAFTNSVVAIFVELSLVAGVGAEGAPVNVGEANGAFKSKSAVFAVILKVFEFTVVGKPAIVLELTPPILFTVVVKLPFPDPVTSPVKVVVAVADITSAPITKPKFVLAPAEVVAPVPPFATGTIPDKVAAAAVIVISALPSKATPLIFLGAANFVDVAALPVVF